MSYPYRSHRMQAVLRSEQGEPEHSSNSPEGLKLTCAHRVHSDGTIGLRIEMMGKKDERSP